MEEEQAEQSFAIKSPVRTGQTPSITCEEKSAFDTSTFTIDAQIRARGEYLNPSTPSPSPEQNHNLLINQRARITLEYLRRNLQFKASVQHTGLWGQDQIASKNGRVSMSEAWAKAFTNKGLFLQVGRQVLSYDDERILGCSDWNVAGNSHDALRFGLDSDTHKLHLLASISQTATNTPTQIYTHPMPYKNLTGLWYHFQAKKAPVNFSILGLNVGVKPEATETVESKTKYFQLVGTHLTYSPAQFALTASAYFERGTEAITNKDIAAFLASVKAAYTHNMFGAHIAYDYLSGNNERNINQHAFNPLFGTHHNFNGAMDYFTPIVNCGLQDAQAGLCFNIGRQRSGIGHPVTISADYHYFLTAEKYVKYESTLGQELDLNINARILPDITLSGGYSFMFGTKTMQLIQSSADDIRQHWAFISININPRILTIKW